MNRIVVSSYTFEDNDIMSVSGNLQTSIVGDELTVDTFTAVVRGSLSDIPYGSIIRYYHDGQQIGSFYFKSSQRLTRDTWQINGISSIGILDKQVSRGGVYSGQTFSSVLTDIIGPSSHTEPTYYERLEYAICDGNQVINTQIPMSINLGFELDISVSSTSLANQDFVIGTGGTYPTWYFNVYKNSYNSKVLISTTAGIGSCADGIETRRKYYFNFYGDKLVSNGDYNNKTDLTSRWPATETPNSLNLYLLNVNRANSVGFSGNFYECKLTNGNALYRDYIPVRNTTTNEVLIYDSVNQLLLHNLGTQPLQAGTSTGEYFTLDAVEDAQYQEVEYITSINDMCCLDTGYTPTNNTGIKIKCKVDSFPYDSYDSTMRVGSKYYDIKTIKPATRYLFGAIRQNADLSRQLYSLSLKAPKHYRHEYDAEHDKYNSILETKTDMYFDGYIWNTTSSQAKTTLHMPLNSMDDYVTLYFNYENDGYFTIGNTSEQIAKDTLTTNTNLFIGDCSLFNANTFQTGLAENNASMRLSIKEIWITEGSSIVRKYKPVYQKTDGKVGMYDTLTKTFITTKYNGYEFISGPEVNNSNVNFDYVIDSALKNQLIFGWLPYSTKRENLYQLLFATNANIIKGEDGTIIFTYLYDTAPVVKPSSDVYTGGSIDYMSKANKVELTEHTYIADSSVDSVLIYDNTNSTSDSDIAIFSTSPIMVSSLTTTGTITLVETSPNHAKITGVGTISGKPYKHTTGILKSTNNIDTEHTIQVTNATLVSPANSENVLERLTNYYYNADKVSTKMKFNKERCGNYLNYTNPYDENTNGFIRQINYAGSNQLAADYEIIENFTPVSGSNTYNHSVTITEDDTFIVPEGVTQIKVVLIGGGTGGQSGLAGQDGPVGISKDGSPQQEMNYPGGGAGGEGGNPGGGGRVQTYEISTSAGTEYACVIGVGGAGGTSTSSKVTHTNGSDGGNTTFGTYSSATGQRKPYLDLFTGIQYAAEGTIYGQQGGKGGFYTTFMNGNQYLIANGQNITDTRYEGGIANLTQAPAVSSTSGGVLYDYSQAWGGYGGGAAYGCMRTTAMNGLPYAYYNGTYYRGGQGGNGGTPSQPQKCTKPGQGGAGGHGGGGGGNGGSGGYRYTSLTQEDDWHYVSVPGNGGTGGNGGAGGDGADGCIIVYY